MRGPGRPAFIAGIIVLLIGSDPSGVMGSWRGCSYKAITCTDGRPLIFKQRKARLDVHSSIVPKTKVLMDIIKQSPLTTRVYYERRAIISTLVLYISGTKTIYQRTLDLGPQTDDF